MNKIFYLFCIIGIVSVSHTSFKVEVPVLTENAQEELQIDSLTLLYQIIDPEHLIGYRVFKLAYLGFQQVKDTHDIDKKHILTIIDYTHPSVDERLFVVNLEKKIIVHTSLVAHGMNSGANYAVKFSNKSGSLQSSLGFYITGSTYNGKHGYSLKLYGIEHGINDNAYDRAIVIHGANYATEKFIKKNGRLGRSWGCPALPPHISKIVIDTIKDGSCIFIYHDDQSYLSLSQILNKSE